MERFIGTKVVLARPMTRAQYNEYRNWALPADENGNDPGFLVEYLDGGAPNHPKHKGYISWSPRAQFEHAYRLRPAATNLAPHQQRVLDEKAELDEKVRKLAMFIKTPGSNFIVLPEAERLRLAAQLRAMTAYQKVLGERIEAFAA